MDSSIFLSYAYRRQRSALLSGNYIGPLDDQICIQFQQGGTMPPHLGSQHMPVGNPAFDNLLQYLTVSLLQDDQWMAAELPGIKLTLRESDEGISVRERVLIKSLREALNAKTQVKDKQSLSLNLDQNNGLKTNRRNDNDDDNDDDDYDDDASTGRIHMNSTETAPQGTPVQSPHYIAPSPHEGGRSTAGRLLSAVSESNSNGQITDQFADDIGLKKFVQKKKKIKKHRRKRLFD
ncbi:hypothetical protein GNI_041260 [Gregarina niphandrodes]|uniref:Uncharacterized protein n=1 Tax=Gregarina niphandrodes TaxID=110365 RepID=A0A023BAB2_GRENI|nr:hypothetical protein GNI_041260 [Gregarina niphandrodes]EZG77897.1 hypothetical protein GNI_041260 [Gregarina niphandrodes]|eukprot:XP_011129474.1 hypothetical protein GNI_041260 [Gregarina niphandrodes]